MCPFSVLTTAYALLGVNQGKSPHLKGGEPLWLQEKQASLEPHSGPNPGRH